MWRVILIGFILLSGINVYAEVIVAKVGDSVITERDLEDALDHYMPQGGFHIKGFEKRERFKKDALNSLIEEELLYREGLKRGLKVPDEVIEAVIKENIKRLGSRKRFDQVLKDKGLSLKAFRERIRKAQLVQALLRDIQGGSRYSEEELRDYYEKNKARFKRPESIHLYHILIRIDPSLPGEEPEKEATAWEIRQRLDKGENFSDLAMKYSEDPYRVKGGDLGFIHRGQLNPDDLERAAFTLKEGEIAGPIRTIYGFHIIKAGEKRPEEILGFDTIKERLMEELSNKRFSDYKKDLITRLKKEYTVQVFIQLDGGSE